ncbi:hypothetical protein WBG78_14060 [Chryseolinea sp. T2]|uniref:hypothetical protein n=1 Tax=Chryseolinea sp. T2 TaxID=3129255 RepID=UPI0030781B12
MKTTCLWMALTLAINTSFGEIRNGYASGIFAARESMKSLQIQLRQQINNTQRRKIESNLRQVTTYIIYYELTESLLNQFRLIAPEIYVELDSIKDRQGRETDIYVKFIPEQQARILAWGVTNVAQDNEDKDAYTSAYGDHSVSIKIWTVNNALEVLAHELGHVKHQVPHLSDYLEYYNLQYKTGAADPNYIGHDANDISGRTAVEFAKRYREMFFSYWKGGHSQLPSPPYLAETIKRSVNQQNMGPSRNTIL